VAGCLRTGPQAQRTFACVIRSVYTTNTRHSCAAVLARWERSCSTDWHEH